MRAAKATDSSLSNQAPNVRPPVPSIARWVMPSIEDVICLCVLIFILSQGNGLFGDGDTGYHIKTGEVILDTGSVPHDDFYTYTTPGIPWVAHEWLAEVLLAVFYRIGGLTAVGVLTAVVISASVFILARYMMRLGLNVVPVVLAVVFAAIVTKMHWLARPHIFSFFFTVAVSILLDRYQAGKLPRLYFIPLFMVIWANLHSGFMIAFGLIGIYAVGNMFKWLMGTDEQEKGISRARFRHIVWIGILSLIAATINPRGPAIFLFPFQHTGQALHINRTNEWLSPDFHHIFYFELVILFLLLVIWLRVVRINGFELATVILWTHLSLFSVRFIPLFVLTQAPLVARGLNDFGSVVGSRLRYKRIDAIKQRLGHLTEEIKTQSLQFDRHLVSAIIAVVVLSIGLNSGRINHQRIFSLGWDRDSFPIAAVDFLDRDRIEGRIFHTDGYGGYLIYRAYPERKVAIDGRGMAGSTPFYVGFLNLFDALPVWYHVLEEYRADIVLWPSEQRTTTLLRSSPKWALVYSDNTACIFVRDDAAHHDLIRRLGRVSYVFPKEKDDEG